MSNIEEIKVKELDEETLRNLIQQILSEPEKFPTEAKLILVIETWHRQGPSFDDYQRYSLVMGEISEVVLREWDEGYPYRAGREVAIVPLSLPVIIEVESYNETVSPVRSSRVVYVFTTDGWKVVRVY